MGQMMARLNKEEYKGLFKLFLQRNNYALASSAFILALAAVILVIPALPASATFQQSGLTYNTDSGTKISSVGQTSAITTGQAGVFVLTYQKRTNPAVTLYALVGAKDSSVKTVEQTFGDTLSLIKGPDASINDTFLIVGDTTHDTVYLTSDTASTNDTLSYTLSIANWGNGADNIGLVVDTIWLSSAGADTTSTGRFSYQFFGKNGDTLTNVLTSVQQETGRVALTSSSGTAETAMLRIYTKGTVNADTLRVAVRAMANNMTGRVGPNNKEANSYVGLNGVRYGGSGNAMTFVEVSVSGPLLRLAEIDTVFSPASLSAIASDTQRYVPGSLIVYTLWFDNDGNDTGDTVAIEYWIDTRHVRFDSQGLSALQGVSQIAAAGTHVLKGYGNIFVDSAMPTFATTGFNVALEYVNVAGAWASIKSALSPEDVARMRWTISRAGGVIGASNGDDLTIIDSAPIAPTSGGDIDMGYVRFSVVIR